MAAERAHLLSTISDFKAALTRRDDTSDSDEGEVAHGTNRGQKLKRKARFVHEGALNGPVGNKLYEEEIEYGSRKRKILYRKRRRGDSDDEDMSDGERLEDDPYADVHIEKILAPAQTPSDIANHPSLSAPYKSRTLKELCQQSLDIIVSENKHTMTLKNLLTNFLGDDPFVSLEKMETVKEPDYIRAAREKLQQLETQKYEEEQQKNMAEEAAKAAAETNGDAKKDEDVDMGGASKQPSPSDTKKVPAGANGDTTKGSEKKKSEKQKDGEKAGKGSGGGPAAAVGPGRELAQAREILESTDPWFYPPVRDPNARDYGLNPMEAEETRRLLLLAVQKQEEFVRGLTQVRDVLLRAERMRTRVWEWCRADGQEEPSDGEDWVDLERWGLQPGELKKGAEDEEEDDSKKKTTRGRRN